MSSIYERELRSVLAGEEKGVRAVTRSCTESQRAQMMQVCQRPFLVVRAPGSGSEGTGDLLVLRGDMCFPIEVKSSKKSRLYLSGRTVLQFKSVRGDSWRIFRVNVDNLTGKSRRLSSRVPALPLTRNGTPHLDWEQGLPLHKFIALICRSDGARSIESLQASAAIYSNIIETETDQYQSSSPDKKASNLSNS
jgi:hypothetical protein